MQKADFSQEDWGDVCESQIRAMKGTPPTVDESKISALSRLVEGIREFAFIPTMPPRIPQRVSSDAE